VKGLAPRVTDWRLGALAGGLALLLGGAPAWAADVVVSPQGVPPSAATETARFALQVQAPQAHRDLMLKHLNIQRFLTLADLDVPELQRLVDQLPDDARQLMGTQGHFSATATATLSSPSATDPPLGVVTLVVEPGPPAQVGEVVLAVRTATDNPLQAVSSHHETLTQQLRASWPLPSGRLFTQDAWDAAKAQTLRTLTQANHPAATLTGSLADVDTETQRVNLALDIDPGPAFTFGEVEVEGLQRYEAAWVSHMVALAGVVPGSDYELAKLQAAQQRLAQSGYFESVFVYVDPNGPSDRSPVRVKVREALRQKWVLGLGGSTDDGARISAEHQWRQLPWLNWRAQSKMKLERDTRTAEAELSSPVGADGWHWVAGAKASHQTDDATVTTSQQYRLGKAKNEENLDRIYFLQADRSLTRNPLLRNVVPEAAQSVSANFGWTRRQFDNMPFPTRGHGLAAEVGVGWTVAQKGAPFLRARGRWQGLWPLPDERMGRLSVRLEGGAVVAKTSTPVPDSQLFLTGGDQTVRGYALRDIGVPDASGTTNPGRLLTVGSLEWQRPIWSHGVRTAWESTVFVDAGSVANQVSDLHAKVGVGAGVRYISPVGPLQVDLAYGVATRRLRLHLSVGFSF